MNLLTVGTGNIKLGKSDKNSKYLSCGISLLPYKYSGFNVCKFASKACSSTCINFCGLGRLHNVQQARLNKTKLFFENRIEFFKLLYKELKGFVKKAKFLKKNPVCRLNIYSDLPYEKIKPEIFSDFKDVQFMDYTKWPNRYEDWLANKLPPNYYLLFSRSENNEKNCIDYLNKGGNVAVVFRDSNFPKIWNGFKTINGEKSDLRFLDLPNTVCALKAKGNAKKDSSGFVVNI